ncbi:MAG: uroporphyrinogen-III synthase [Tatlockia sp.]|jgi:uroporphyrinogen-III synthase
MSSLNGLTVLNTRPLAQAKALSEAIRAAGGWVVECPALTIVPAPGDWVQSLPSLKRVDKAVFISANAVHCCFNGIKRAGLDWPGSIEVIAIGDATAHALAQQGVLVHFTPHVADSEHVLGLNALQTVRDKRILVFKGVGGRTLIPDHLTAAGARLQVFDVYQRELPSLNKEQMDSLWRNDAVDIILFTSEQAMRNLFTLFGQEAQAWLCSKPCIVLSERLAKAAAAWGICTILTSAPDKIIQTLQQFNQG